MGRAAARSRSSRPAAPTQVTCTTTSDMMLSTAAVLPPARFTPLGRAVPRLRAAGGQRPVEWDAHGIPGSGRPPQRCRSPSEPGSNSLPASGCAPTDGTEKRRDFTSSARPLVRGTVAWRRPATPPRELTTTFRAPPPAPSRRGGRLRARRRNSVEVRLDVRGTPVQLGFRTERTTVDDGIRTRDPHLGKVMEFVRVDRWGPLSRLSSAGSSAQSAESARLGLRLFNALNGSPTHRPRSSRSWSCTRRSRRRSERHQAPGR
jgi:hypothetical protein